MWQGNYEGGFVGEFWIFFEEVLYNMGLIDEVVDLGGVIWTVGYWEKRWKLL